MSKKNFLKSIYIYENLINGKVYIGQTCDMVKRDKNHIKGIICLDKTKNKISIVDKGKTWKLIDGKRVWIVK